MKLLLISVLVFRFCFSWKVDPVWHHEETVPIYNQNFNIWAAAGIVETKTNPDFVQLFNISSSGDPFFQSLCHKGRSDASRNGNTRICVSTEESNSKTNTLHVWQGDELKYSTALDLDNVASVRVSSDGSVIAVLGSQSLRNFVLLIFSPSSPTPKSSWTSEEMTIWSASALSLSNTGDLVTFRVDGEVGNNTHFKAFVYDTKLQKTIFETPNFPHSQAVVGLSANGEFLFCAYKQYVLYQRTQNGEFKEVYSGSLPDGDATHDVSVSESGEVIVASSWYELGPQIIYLDSSGEQIWLYDYQYGGAQILSNVPTMAATSDDFQFLCVSAWGNQTEDSPQIRVWDLKKREETNKKESDPVFQFSTPGSMLCCDVVRGEGENEGKVWVVAGGKKVHETQMGKGGDLYLFELNS